MEILRPQEFNFEQNVLSGLENINSFYKVLKQNDTKYFWDLDSILGNSIASVFGDFNLVNEGKVKANIWEVDRLNYLTYLVKNLGMANREDVEAGWYKNMPLYHAHRYEYAKKALDIAIEVSGTENNYILTSRLPKLKRATDLWVRREIPEFDRNNILIRTKDDERKSAEFKSGTLMEHANKDRFVVLIEDQESYISHALKADIPNLLVIGVPAGVIRYETQDERLLVLSRYPFKEQEMQPLYTLFQNSQNHKD